MLSRRRRVSMPDQRMNRNCQGAYTPRSPCATGFASVFYNTRLRDVEKQRHQISCLAGLGIGVFLVLMVCLWPAHVAWYWGVLLSVVAVVLGVMGTSWIYPALPGCPSCQADFDRLGFYCPDCGHEFPREATPQQAYCPACQYLVEIVSARPMAKCYRKGKMGWRNVANRDGISRYPPPDEGPVILKECIYVTVPLNFCTVCGKSLSDDATQKLSGS